MVKVLSRKVVLIALAVVIALGGVIWAIVANLKPSFHSGIPGIKDQAVVAVSGNGSSSVMVNDYLYFVGDFVVHDEIKYGDNDYFANGKVQSSAIYRVRIADNRPVLDYEYNNQYTEDGVEKEYDENDYEHYNQMQNCTKINDWQHIGNKNYGIQAVVPKIAGHDATAMWVYGNNLIYTTPYNLKNGSGTLLSNYLQFYRVDLNGANHQHIYTTTTPTSDADSGSQVLTTDHFTVWANSTNQIYLLIAEADSDGTYTLKRINVKTGAVTTMDTKVTNFVFPRAAQYRENGGNQTLAKTYGGVMRYVYYTKAWDEDHSENKGNLMYRYQIDAGADYTTEKISTDGNFASGITYQPLTVAALNEYNAQFIYSVTEQSSGQTFPVKYAVVTSEQDYQTPQDFAQATTKAIDLGVTSDHTVQFYAGGYWSKDQTLYQYGVVDGKIDEIENQTVVASAVEKVLTVFGRCAYVQASGTVLALEDGKVETIAFDFGESSADADESGDDTSSADTSLVLPAAVLFQARATGEESGSRLIFFHTADSLKLVTADGTSFAYLRLKSVA